MSDEQTSNCIYCGEKAVIWRGHVLLGKRKIIAGWCFRHQPSKKKKQMEGFYGHYQDWMNEEVKK